MIEDEEVGVEEDLRSYFLSERERERE